MVKYLLTIAVCGFLCFRGLVPADASILPGTWVVCENNVYEDQDRVSVWDLDKNKELSVGDVFTGFLRVDGRTLPTLGVDIPPSGPDGGLYAVFAHEVKSIRSRTTGVDTDGDGVDDLFFNDHFIRSGPVVNPVAVGWLDLPTLAPKAVPAPGQGPPMVAVYEEVPIDLINNLPGGAPANGVRFTVLDYMRYIDASGKLDLTLGFGIPPGEDIDGPPIALDDYWVSWADNVLAATDTTAFLPNFALFNIPSGVGASFQAGLSAIGMALDPLLLEDQLNTPVVKPLGVVGQDEHELLVESGDVTGAANIFFLDLTASGGPPPVPFGNNNPFFGDPGTMLPGPDDVFGTADDVAMPAEKSPAGVAYNFYGASSNADITMHPSPEPATLVIWSLLGLLAGASIWRRRRAA